MSRIERNGPLILFVSYLSDLSMRFSVALVLFTCTNSVLGSSAPRERCVSALNHFKTQESRDTNGNVIDPNRVRATRESIHAHLEGQYWETHPMDECMAKACVLAANLGSKWVRNSGTPYYVYHALVGALNYINLQTQHPLLDGVFKANDVSGDCDDVMTKLESYAEGSATPSSQNHLRAT